MRINKIIAGNPAIALGLCGFVAAFVNVFVNINAGDAFLGSEMFIYVHGFTFGIILAGYLFFAKNLFWIRALVLIALFGVSWICALQSAIFLYSWRPDTLSWTIILSLCAGAIGATIVASGFVIAYPKYRTVKAVCTTVIVGTIFGSLLAFELEWDYAFPAILWVVWQTAVGASLGWDRRIFE